MLLLVSAPGPSGKRHGDQSMGEACVIAVAGASSATAGTSSAIAELVGGLTASFESVWDAFQVVFDGARRNPCAKLNGQRLNGVTRFRHL